MTARCSTPRPIPFPPRGTSGQIALATCHIHGLEPVWLALNQRRSRLDDINLYQAVCRATIKEKVIPSLHLEGKSLEARSNQEGPTGPPQGPTYTSSNSSKKRLRFRRKHSFLMTESLTPACCLELERTNESLRQINENAAHN